MTSNAEAAEIFLSIADLLDLLGEKFKPEAYRRAARSIESLTEDLGAVAARGELRTIPGVGEAIAEKIEEYLKTGTIPYYERLKHEVPPGLVELMRLPGIGPKTARRFWVELGVEGPGELRDAIAKGRLNGLKGFGEKKIEQIRSALGDPAAAPKGGRRPIEEVYPIARGLVAGLRKGADVEQVEVAGSFRRCRETVGDLDILVTSKDPARVFDVFTGLPLVAEVKMRGGTKETVLLQDGLQVDLRVVKPEEFGSALVYFTGSKDHNIRLRSLAQDQGLKVNEYGVFRGDVRVAGATEKDVYASLGLAWIPPELREDRGEIDRAAQGKLPVLVAPTDLRGDLHVHLPPDARAELVDRLVADARARHLEYLGVVVAGPAPDGTTWTLSKDTRERLGTPGRSSLRLFRVLEVGFGEIPPALASVEHDYRILRPTLAAPGPSAGTKATGPSLLIAHVGSSVVSDGRALAPWLEVARTLGTALEVGPGAERLDSSAARQALESQRRLHLPTGVGGPTDDPTGAIALGFAHRAAATAHEVVNARPAGELSIGAAGPPRPPEGRSHGRRKARPGTTRAA
jgi:DNA polymerase/3'-5' exonuclease PolX